MNNRNPLQKHILQWPTTVVLKHISESLKQKLLKIKLYMSNTASILYKAEPAYPSRAPEFSFGFWCGPVITFLCCPIMCLYVLSSVLWCLLRFPYKTDVKCVFTSSCLLAGVCNIYVICICLRIVLSNTYCGVFWLCFSSSCVL
jgi:hypothetical protein